MNTNDSADLTTCRPVQPVTDQKQIRAGPATRVTLLRHRESWGPPALWQLINIAEVAGLIVSSNESAVAHAFRADGPKPSAIKTELDRFKCSLIDLYVVVTLFSAAPHPVPLENLARETLADPLSLQTSLDHLEEVGVISTEASATGAPAVQLTSLGQNFAVLLTYRVINAACAQAAKSSELGGTFISSQP